MKYVSYSLYGLDPVYREGLVRNILSVQRLLPDYVPIAYLSVEQDDDFVQKLRGLGAKVVVESDDWPRNGMFWRFLVIFEDAAERILIRDCDSDILERDVAAVRAWELSEKSFHIMRDHPLHAAPIMGGMWGAKVDFLRPLVNKSDFMRYTDSKGLDQEYLAMLYPKVVSRSLIHDSIFRYERGARRFPIERKNLEFLGEPLDEFGHPTSLEARVLLERFEKSPFTKLRYLISFSRMMMRVKTEGVE